MILGTLEPQSCATGFVTGREGAESVGECDICPAGYYCPGVLPVTCTPGHYCEAGTETPTPCPVRTYNPYGGMT